MNKISVIVPVYNVEKYLRRCIESIINQSYSDLEIILINDGSTDKSATICDIYKNNDLRIILINQENKGLSNARNTGLEIATGDYISFVDGDDWIVNDIYEYCLNIFNKTDCDVVDFGVKLTSEENETFQKPKRIIETVVKKNDILYNYLSRGQTENVPFSVCRKIYKKYVVNTIKFPYGKINEDIVTNFVFLRNSHKMLITSKIGYIYFNNVGSITKKSFTINDFNLIFASKQLIKLANEENDSRLIFLAKVKLSRSYFSLLAKIYKYGFNESILIKNREIIINTLTKLLRKNIFYILFSPIRLRKKLLVLLFCLNTYSFFKVYRKFRNSFSL